MTSSRKTQTNERRRRKIPHCLSIIFPSKWKANSSLTPIRGNSSRRESISKNIQQGSNSADVAERKHSDVEETLVNAFSNLDLYCPHRPAAWKGGFIIHDLDKYWGGLLAQSPGDTYKFSLPSDIDFNILGRSSDRDYLFKEDELALYFIPENDEESKGYQNLFDLVVKKDVMLKSCMDDFELLVFSSVLLHPDARKAVLQNDKGKDLAMSERREFLCGVFLNVSKRRKIPYCLSIIFPSKWKANSSLTLIRGNSKKHESISKNIQQVSKGSNSADVAERKHSDVEERDLVNAFSNLDLYCSHRPAAWKGGFIIHDLDKYWGGLLAQSPGDTYEFSLPSNIDFYILGRSSDWDDLFKEDELALYFIPENDEEPKGYQNLFDLVVKKDVMLKSCMDDFELLVFSSVLLHPDAKKAVLQNDKGKELARSERREFLCGAFLVGGEESGREERNLVTYVVIQASQS